MVDKVESVAAALSPVAKTALAVFDAGDGGWQTDGMDELLDLDLIGTEESWDGSAFWLTDLGEQVLAALQPKEPEHG